MFEEWRVARKAVMREEKRQVRGTRCQEKVGSRKWDEDGALKIEEGQ